MIKTFVELFKNKETRKKIYFTLVCLVIVRLGVHITAPNINQFYIKASLNNTNSILDMMNLLGGGFIQSFAIFSMGVGPYITASIVFELLSMDVIPHFTNLKKEGEKGRKQLDTYTRYLSVVLCFVQSISLLYATNISNPGLVIDPSFGGYFKTGLVMTAGSMFMLWIADQITKKGIGNGTSMLIFVGIVANIPQQFQSTYADLLGKGFSVSGLISFIMFVVMYFLIIVLVAYMGNAERRIPIHYTSSSLVQKKSDKSYLPLKINSASVIPVIFASAIMTAPLTVLSFFNNQTAIGIHGFLNKIFSLTTWNGLLIYSILIILFTFFYTNLQVDPKKISQDLAKNGSYIVSIRPGDDTFNYIKKVLNRITVLGALFLLFIALIPYLIPMIFNIPHRLAIGGTGMIIVVGVAQETMKSLSAQLTQRKYSGFKRGR